MRVQTGRISILLAMREHPDPLWTNSLSELLKKDGDFKLLAESSDPEAVAGLVRGHKPGVLILDEDLCPGFLLRFARAIRGMGNPPEVVLLGKEFSHEFMLEAVSSGVGIFLSKSGLPAEILDCLRSNLTPSVYIS